MTYKFCAAFLSSVLLIATTLLGAAITPAPLQIDDTDNAVFAEYGTYVRLRRWISATENIASTRKVIARY